MRKQKKHRNNPGYPVISRLAAFLLPAALLLAAFAAADIFPFGDRSLLLVDMDNEYIEYYSRLNRVFREGGSPLRTWEMGMGLNMTGLIAFYTASPLHLLLYLIPIQWLTEGVLLLTLVKVGLCGLTFHLFAEYGMQRRVPLPVITAASVAYALCGYNICYTSNLMWLDGVAALPLVCLGIEKLLREERSLLLTAALVYVFLAGYYIGYMVGLFSFLYLLASCGAEGFDLPRFLGLSGRLLLSAVMAAGCCAFLLLPAFLELRHGQSGLWSFAVSWPLDIPLSGFAVKLMPGVYDSLTDSGLPNLYSTLAALLGSACFFGARGIPRREKVAFGCLTLALLLSFSCGILDLAWHAFEDPTWFPARYSFVFSFLLLRMGLQGAAEIRSVRPGALAACCGVLLLLFVDAGIHRYSFVERTSLILALAGLAVYAGLAFPARRRQGFALLLLLLVCVESGYHARKTVQGMEEEFGYKTRRSYSDYRDRYLPAVRQVQGSLEQPGRMELLEQRNANGGLALGYMGMSHYSTTTDQTLHRFLRRMGYNTGTVNELRHAVVPPLTDGLFGIRYLLSAEGEPAGYRPTGRVGEVTVYENPVWFPLAWFAEERVLELPYPRKGEDPFLYQNRMLEAMGGTFGSGNAFLPLEIASVRLEHLEAEEMEEGTRYTRTGRTQAGILELELRNGTGHPAWAWLPLAGSRTALATAYVDGQPVQQELGYRHNSPVYLGTGEQVTLRMEITSGSPIIGDIYAYALDLSAAERTAEQARMHAVSFQRFSDTRLVGTVTAPREGVLMTSIPVDPGWRIRLDGQRVEPVEVAGTFLALHLPPGDHLLELRYLPPGLLSGSIITFLTLAILVASWLFRKKVP